MGTETKEPATNLTAEVKRLNRILTRVYRQQSFASSFVRGILTGLGSVIGATLVVGLIAFLLRNINIVPIVGDWLSDIFTHVLNNLPQNN